MAISNYTPSANRIVHNTAVDFKEGMSFGQPVHLMQYDKSLPVVVVSLYSGGKVYSIPSNADVCVRVGKPDGTKVYNPVLGCNADRTICYFEVTQQMTSAYGAALAILEITVGGDIAGSSYVPLDIAKNPAQDDAIESSDEYQIMTEVIADAQAVLTNPPKIQNGNWWIWDSEKKAYADSGYSAGGGGASETEVFICTISGSASSGYSCNKTIDEINTAYLAGKLVYAKDDTRVMPLVAIAHPQIAQFCVTLAGGGLVGYSITGSGTVMAISQQMQLKKLVTSISSSSNNTDYPSAKAVWAAIPHPVAKTDAMTQAVGVSDDGKLYTQPSSGSSTAQKLIVTATVSGYNAYDGQPTVDKTLDEIKTAYDSGTDVYAKVYVGSDYLCLAPCVFCSADHAMFSAVYADSPDTPDVVNYVSLYVFDGGCEAYVASSSMFVPRVTSADNGKALVVKNGAWSVENVSGGEKAWTKIIDVDVTETTMSFQNDSLNGVTEFNIRWSDLQNVGTSRSGLNLVVNGIEIGTYGIAGIVSKSGTNAYGWTYAKYDGLFWHIAVSSGSASQNSNIATIPSSVCCLADNVGAADSIKMSAASSEKAPVFGKLEVWAR